MRIRWTLSAAFAGILATACGGYPELVPGPGAQPAPDMRGGAMAEYAGVRMSAAGDRWTGFPRRISGEVTPILVRLENNGTKPLAIRYQLFEFVHPDAKKFEAIPPFDIDETVEEPVDIGYPASRFYVAPYLRGWYRYDPYWDPFYFDRSWYGTRYTVWQRIELPSADMIRMALPEGVLEPGGVVEGFVYFEHLRHDDEQATLSLNLVTPGGENFGRIQIPFTVE